MRKKQIRGYILNLLRRARPPKRIPLQDHPKNGIECVFIKINRKKGIKLFARRCDARRSMRRQHECYVAGIAPRVLSDTQKYLFRFRVNPRNVELCEPFKRNCIYFGYETEYFRPLNKLSVPQREKLTQKIHTMENIYEKLFERRYPDSAERNLGIKNGKVVILDFGAESIC